MKYFYIIFLSFISATAIANDDEHHHGDHHNEEFVEHASHEHGHASADISYIEDTLKIDIHMSAIDVFGFEHTPQSQAEDEAVFDGLSKLEDVSNVIKTNPDCAIVAVNVASDIISEEESHHHEDDGEENNHSDVEASYELRCSTSIELNFTIFNTFTSLEEVVIQYVSQQDQDLYTAKPDTPTIMLNR